jgi:hypothetical protein
LLAKDFANDDMTVVMNYAKDGKRVIKKSITVTTDSRKIDVAADGKITLDGQKVELPQKIGNTVVRRERDVVLVENNNGLKVECNLVHDVCTTELDGQYFGKTGGLMGTYDYEDATDMMTPDHELLSDSGLFAGEWEVGQAKCRKNVNLADPITKDPQVERICSDYFEKKQSPLRACFSIVDPAPYRQMCLHGVRHNNEDLCASASAYRQECLAQGMEVAMPRECVRCEKPDGAYIKEGEFVTLNEPSSNADVTFVIESKKMQLSNHSSLETSRSKCRRVLRESWTQRCPICCRWFRWLRHSSRTPYRDQ